MQQLFDIVTRLRAPDGCPWDREQTHASLRGALIEECYEVVDAINRSDDANLREELGDLLLHVVFHAQLAEARGAFAFDEVAADICEKLIRRHPHVFAGDSALNTEEVLQQWEQIKRKEKGEGTSILDSRDSAQPALMRAQNVQKKAARVGFDWSEAAPVFDKLSEEIAELKEAMHDGRQESVEDELGDILFTVVNLSRKVKVDAESALTQATNKFIRRFQQMESDLTAEGKCIDQTSLEELDARWNQAKRSTQS